jgi:hypothetical protein
MATATIDVREQATARTARESLRGARRELQAAEQIARAAVEAARRGSENVERARTALEVFRNLDAEADTFRRDAIRSGKSASLPAALRQKQHERGEAKTELDGALRASADLARERDAAFAELEHARESLRYAANRTVLEQAVEVARELIELNQRRQLLQLLLTELTDAIPSRMGTSDFATALSDQGRQLPLDQSPRHRAADYWRRQVARLTQDVEAPLEPLPRLVDLFGY